MSDSLPTEQEREEGPQTDLFQIANGNVRQACSVARLSGERNL